MFMNDLTRTELDAALAVHREICQTYPRQGDGENMYVVLDRETAAAAGA